MTPNIYKLYYVLDKPVIYNICLMVPSLANVTKHGLALMVTNACTSTFEKYGTSVTLSKLDREKAGDIITIY